ncbi:MAG TPA: glycine cleavage T C-terminal barrel domain-containing protein [Thermoplasmata archaeon]|nr:glycine cleavage T C-terminal barrel domain-containing protein [Thermoplasmata archaeon]
MAATDYAGPILPGFRETAWIQKSPFFHRAAKHGVRAYDLYNHMLMPGLYTDPVEEYWHLVNHVTLWDVGVERQVEIDGPDGFEFMQLLTPRDMRKCKVGECKYVLLTTPDGGIINDPVLLRLGEDHFWLSLSDWDVLFWCKGVAVNAGLDVVVREPDVSPLQLQGPKSKDVMVDLFGDGILDLEYYHLTETDLDGIPLVITRTGWSAERGYELYLRDSKYGEALWDKVMAAGKKHNIRPIAPSEIRRIEAGILNYSSDIMLDNNPYEVGLGWTVDEDKSDEYLGKVALQRIKRDGVTRKLVGVEVEGAPLGAWIPDYWDVHADGRKVGHVTSLTYSPRLERNIGYALLAKDHAKLGTPLKVATSKGLRSATVVKKPFVDPKKDIPKS